MAAVTTPDNKWACPTCTYENPLSRQTCEMCETHRPHMIIQPQQQSKPQQSQPKPSKKEEASLAKESNATANNNNNNSNTTFKFKKFMGSTTKLFGGNKANTTNDNDKNNTNTTSNLFQAKVLNNNGNGQNTKSVQELLDDIEILKMQKDDLRKLVQERTHQLDQMKKLDGEHQRLRQRWKENEEKAANEVQNAQSYTQEIQQEIQDLKQQNAVLQSKQTNNDLIKNKLENKLRERMEEDAKNKKLIERKSQEKKMLVAEVLKLRNEKQELISLYKTEIDKLNNQNTNNIQQLQQLNEQQQKSQQLEYESNVKALNNKYDELDLIYKNYKHNITQKISNIDSTTNAFESMIQNANVGNLSQDECNKILDNIINSIETMEKENEKYHQILHERNSQHTLQGLSENNDDNEDMNELEKEQKIDGDIENDNEQILDEDKVMTPMGSDYNYKVDMDEDMLLNKIESRVLKTLREKALLQRSTNELMFQLEQMQKGHEQEMKIKDDIIRQHEIRAKVSFFKKKQPKE